MTRWPCSAYGEEGTPHGALCFLSGERGVRLCASQDECAAVMTAERQRVFRRIQETAAAGDEAAEFLAGEFTSPEELLGGGQADAGLTG